MSQTCRYSDIAPAEGVEAISASLGAALAVADHLPAGAAGSLTSSAREVFVSGMAATGLTGAVLLLILAGGSWYCYARKDG
ncbi:hypothetical protein [Nocardiopsis metallicus]|uniref:Uncharacterized protein n=1 Tax=Nocardiopsis metallicus TaxID=179819 RepID=A0A840WAK2_9ACTN|nr:hypothetical protein [Nocardiopsis metallicus]MBB5492423.1 hypothetical protein [Nocardiopsis metallicus]